MNSTVEVQNWMRKARNSPFAQIPQRTVQYSGMIDAFRKTLSSEGVRAFYKGFGAVAAMTMPAHALYFGGYEASKLFLQPSRSDAEKSPWVHFTSGLFADICGSIIWVPMDVIKQRVQNARGDKIKGFENSWSAARSIFAREGLRGLYRGSVVAVGTFGPYVGIYFTFYEHFKLTAAKIMHTTTDKLGLSWNLSSALVAASLSALLTCPIDVVKTNMQVYSTHDGGARNTLDAVKTLYQKGGLAIFMRGWNARILWLAPGSAVTMAAYEQCKAAIAFFYSSSKS